MRDVYASIADAGAELVIVGSGQPEHARAFRDAEKIGFPLYVDPALEAYGKAGLRRGVASAFRISLFKNAARAWRKGFRQTKTQGDPWQQGGAFVITPNGELLLSYISQTAGDHVDTRELLDAVDRARVAT